MATARQALLTAVSGVAALILDTSLLWVLTRVASVHYLIAATAGMVVGITFQYAVSRTAIFPHTGRRMAAEVALFLGVFAIGVCLNNAVMYVLVDSFGVGVLASKLVATALVFISNFVLRKWVVFRPLGHSLS